MTHDHDTAVHQSCPHCHLPIQDGQSSIVHEGHSYHQHCTPKPEISGDKDQVHPSLISI